MGIKNVQNDKSGQDPKDKVADVLERKAKLELGLMGSALQSIRRGLAWEHKMVEQGDGMSTQVEGVDDVGPLIIGDVSISNNQNTPQMTKNTNSWLVPTALVIGSLLAGGGVSAALLSLWKSDKPPAVIQVPGEDEDTQYSIQFAKPKNPGE